MTLKGLNELDGKGFVIQNEAELTDQKVRVLLKGPRLQIEKIKANPDLVEIKLDITKYVNNISANMDMVAHTVPVEISVPIGLTIVEQSPQALEVIFEREKTITKKISHFITGGSNEEYQTLTPKIVPGEIEIWGAESLTEAIAEVRVDIDVENFSEDVLTYKTPIKIYDADGEEITGLRQSHQHADVTLPIGKKKTVPLEMQFTGQLPEGFVQVNAAVYPQNITIIGKPALVDKIKAIKLETISLDNIIQTSKINTKFILPSGISYLDPVENSAVVTIQVKEQSVYDYNIDLLRSKPILSNRAEDLEYELISTEVNIKVKSIAEDLLKINHGDVIVGIDFNGYEPGEHEIPLTVKLPPNIILLEQPVVTVKVTAKTIEEPAGPEDEETGEEGEEPVQDDTTIEESR